MIRYPASWLEYKFGLVGADGNPGVIRTRDAFKHRDIIGFQGEGLGSVWIGLVAVAVGALIELDAVTPNAVIIADDA